MLIPFRGRCQFRMYVPNKAARYGLKVQILSDAQTHYMLNAEVYVGKNELVAKNKMKHPTEVVLRLTEPIKNTSRNMTADNWYSSLELVRELQKRKLSFVGTLKKKNKPCIPPEFLPLKRREVESSLFGFTATETIVSFVPKKQKSVILISSMHHDSKVHKDSKNPDIILFYNDTKGGVDSLDQKCARYSTSRRTRRWPMAIFHALLNIAGVNSRVLYQFARNGQEISRYEFLKQVGRELCLPYMRNELPRTYLAV